MPYPPLSPGAVAEIVCRYRRGDSTAQVARALRVSNSTVVAVLEREGVARRKKGDALRGRKRVTEGQCRCCSIIMEKAGCGSREGVCDDCWEEAEKRARAWGVSVEEAMARWTEEGRRIESGEAELEEWCSEILRGETI